MISAPKESGDRAPVGHFERLYRGSMDPWSYETSAYEREKYARTMAMLPEHGGRTLELGCSIGVFTQMLAPRCASLLAVDFSPTAVSLARRRLSRVCTVEIARLDLPEQTPKGPFETIVCSELLYYWSPSLVREGLQRMEESLAPEGVLLAVHWRGSDPRRELAGQEVHAILRKRSRLCWDTGEQTPDYVLDRWCKR